MSEYQTVTVTVPTVTVPRLLQFAADLAQPEAKDERHDAIVAAYRGGSSNSWRPFLDYLADRPGEWVSSDVMGKRLGFSRDQLAGMLGAAGRRISNGQGGGRTVRVYDMEYFNGRANYRMKPEVATIVKALRG